MQRQSRAHISHEVPFKVEVQVRARVSIGLRLGKDGMKTEYKLGVMPHSYNPSTCKNRSKKNTSSGATLFTQQVRRPLPWPIAKEALFARKGFTE